MPLFMIFIFMMYVHLSVQLRLQTDAIYKYPLILGTAFSIWSWDWALRLDEYIILFHELLWISWCTVKLCHNRFLLEVLILLQMQKIFHHSYAYKSDKHVFPFQLDGPEMHRAITLHPVKDPQVMFEVSVWQYYSEGSWWVDIRPI